MIESQEKKQLVDRLMLMQQQGVTKSDALNTLIRDRDAGLFSGIHFTQLQEAVAQVYRFADELDARRNSEAAKQVNAAKLYDTLIAAGWRPPA